MCRDDPKNRESAGRVQLGSRYSYPPCFVGHREKVSTLLPLLSSCLGSGVHPPTATSASDRHLSQRAPNSTYALADNHNWLYVVCVNPLGYGPHSWSTWCHQITPYFTVRLAPNRFNHVSLRSKRPSTDAALGSVMLRILSESIPN